MIGGEAADLEAARPVLSAMGKKIFHVGPSGAGQTVKLAMNLLLALEVDAFAEALALVTGAGLAGGKLVEVMQSSMARSGVLDVKAPVMLKADYTPSFPLRLMHKDLSLALDLGNQLGFILGTSRGSPERIFGSSCQCQLPPYRDRRQNQTLSDEANETGRRCGRCALYGPRQHHPLAEGSK
jgi:hypothetical protein